MKCPECGHINRRYAGFCENCQADLRYLPNNEYKESNRNLKNNLRITVIMLFLAVIVFFIIRTIVLK